MYNVHLQPCQRTKIKTNTNASLQINSQTNNREAGLSDKLSVSEQ